MIGQALYKNLKKLVEIDKKLNELISKIETSQNILKKDQTQIPLLKSEIEEYKSNYLDKKKYFDLLELEAKSLKEEGIQKKLELENITNVKEYKSVEKELKFLELKTLEQDNKLMKVWHKLETIEKSNKEIKKINEEKIRQLKESISHQEKALADQKKDVSKLEQKRNEALKDIPKNWLARYERMRHKVVDPIVPVLGNACSACYYTILRQDITKLKKAGVLLCRNCYRFLYYDQEEEKDIQKESF